MNKLYSKFVLTISSTNSFLLLGQKIELMPFSRYLITLDKTTNKEWQPGAIGKLSSNFKATEYNFYDNGQKYSSTKLTDPLRIQQGSVIYASLFLVKYLGK